MFFASGCNFPGAYFGFAFKRCAVAGDQMMNIVFDNCLTPLIKIWKVKTKTFEQFNFYT